MVVAYLGLGSNLDAPALQLQQAFEALKALPDSRLTGVSALYTSAPISPVAQPHFLNAAARLQTTLQPTVLLQHLQAIETAQGRRRGPRRWGPRTLDIDLLLYGEQRIDSAQLRVPHPEMARRAFVLLPLQELDAALVIPGAGTLSQLLPQVRNQAIRRLSCEPSPTAAAHAGH